MLTLTKAPTDIVLNSLRRPPRRLRSGRADFFQNRNAHKLVDVNSLTTPSVRIIQVTSPNYLGGIPIDHHLSTVQNHCWSIIWDHTTKT